MEKANVHLPNNNKPEHFFVHLSLIDINDAKTLDHNYIIIESDNCKHNTNLVYTFGQFKSFLTDMEIKSFTFAVLLNMQKAKLTRLVVLPRQ